MVEPPKVPAELPGEMTAPVPAVTLPTVPEPPRVEPVARLTLPTEPLTVRRPELAGSETLTVPALTPVAILSEP